MYQLLLGVKLPRAALPVAVGLIDDFRLLFAFIFVPFLLHQGCSFWLFLGVHWGQGSKAGWGGEERGKKRSDTMEGQIRERKKKRKKRKERKP